MKMKNRTAIIICNYNMPERTDALCDYITMHVKLPYDLIVVDNGSDLAPPSRYTGVEISKNVQTTKGFLAGLEYADHLANACEEEYFAYWLIITSAAFIKGFVPRTDPLKWLLPPLENDNEAFCVHPAIDFGGEEAWSKHLAPRNGRYRRIWGVDLIAPLFRASYFNQIGRLRPELTMAWNVSTEACYLARKQGWHTYVCDDFVMKKETDIGYKMDRMNMSADDRRKIASEESDRVLIPIYGKNYHEVLAYDYREKGTNGEY